MDTQIIRTKVNSPPRYQRGLSPIGWLLVLMVGGFFLLVAFKVAPPYFDNIYVKDALKSLTELESRDYGYDNVSKNQVTRHLSNYFTINNVRSVSVKDVEVEKQRRGLIVNLNYEVRVPFIYNIDVLITFENQFDSSRPDECCKPQSE